MKAARLLARVALALGLGALVPCVMGQDRPLQHDPFAKPALLGPPAASPGGATRRAQKAPVARPKLNLHALLVAGPDSIANVDGVMVRVGDAVNGYRLVEVEDRSAVFEKDGARFTFGIGGTK
jgi:hypothetical protein